MMFQINLITATCRYGTFGCSCISLVFSHILRNHIIIFLSALVIFFLAISNMFVLFQVGVHFKPTCDYTNISSNIGEYPTPIHGPSVHCSSAQFATYQPGDARLPSETSTTTFLVALFAVLAVQVSHRQKVSAQVFLEMSIDWADIFGCRTIRHVGLFCRYGIRYGILHISTLY